MNGSSRRFRGGGKARGRKTLHVDVLIIDAIADLAAAMDQKSQGKEGGRIVRKLIADIVESSLQRAISENVAQYQASSSVHVTYDVTNDSSDSGHSEPDSLLGSDRIKIKFD